MIKTKTINLRSQDRSNNLQNVFNSNVSVNKCNFNLEKPITILSGGQVALRSAFFPITYKTIDQNNDRFIIKFLPAVNSSNNDSVYVVCQLQHGYYNSSSAIKTEVNRVLGLLNSTTSATIDNNEGGLTNQYSTDTTAILSAGMSCALGTDDNEKDHLIFTLPVNVVFSGTGVKSGDDSEIGSTALVGGFQILFGDQITGSRFPVINRTCHKILGFGRELLRPNTLNDIDFNTAPVNVVNRGTAVQILTSEFISIQMRTPYLNVRSNLVRDCRESMKKFNASDLLCKIPVNNSTYGSLIFYEPNDSIFFKVPPGEINNIEIIVTDSEGKLINFDSNDWEIMLTFKGEFM